MKKIFLNYMMRKLAGTQGEGRHFAVRRLGPLGGLLVLALLAVIAVIGLVGFVALSAVFAVYALGRSLLAGPRIAPKKSEATITVLDADGKTVAEVPRSA